MADTPLPAPTNKWVNLINSVMDVLIKGLGADAAIITAEAYAPWLKLPIIESIFKYLVNWLAAYIDSFAQKNIDIIVIRFQSDVRKQEYDTIVDKIKKQGADANDIAEAIAAMDRLVNRSR